MTELAVVLALASSLTWGVSDFLGGLRSRSLPQLEVLLMSQGTTLVLLVATVIALGDRPAGIAAVLAAALGGVGEAIGVAALYRGLAVGAMGAVAPVAATEPLVPVVVGAARGELPGPVGWIGITIAITGIVLVSRSRPVVVTPRTARGLTFGLLAALGFGASFIGTDASAESGVAWALLVARITTVAIFVGVAAATRSPVAMRPRDVPALATIGLLVLGADALYASATTRGPLGVVAVLSSLFPVVTILLARLVLHERLRRGQLCGVGLCVVAAATIAST